MDQRSDEDKLKELEDKVADVVLRYGSEIWGRYAKINGPRQVFNEWTRTVRLAVILNEKIFFELMDLLVVKSEEELINYFITRYSVSSDLVQCPLIRLCQLLSDRVGRGGHEWKGHRVVCWVMAWMVGECNFIWSNETVDSVVNYLVKVLECDDMEMVKWAILTGERWWVRMKMNSERRDRLRTALTRHSQTLTDTLLEAMDREGWDAERYQVGWCARWFEENLIGSCIRKIPKIKLSWDRFETRSEAGFRNDYFPVRSPFPVKSNAYFYEVTCVTNGEIELGWCTRKARMDNFSGIGDDEHSFSLNVKNQCSICHNYKRYHIPSQPLLGLNVYGCLLDKENKRFEFYLNGQALECPTPAHFSSQLYFATARLSSNQQCHFNFGQCPFKFPPRNIRFTTFNKQSGGDASKYRLMETKWCDNFWFAHTPVDNQVSLFLDDEMQNEVDREVRSVVEDIENDRDIRKSKLEDDGYEERMWKGVRYMQAIIEVIGNVSGDDKVDVIAQWVGQVIEDMIDKVYRAPLLELLNPYLHLDLTQSTLTKHRSICIVILHLIKCCRHHKYSFIKHIHSSIFTYLTRTLTSKVTSQVFHDKWIQLFALIALGDLEMSEDEMRQIEGCAKIGQTVETCRETFEGKDVGELIKSGLEYRLKYQLYLCSHKLLNVISSHSTNQHSVSNNNATLNPHDLTPQLTLSPCHLSARSDWHWQSVRSVCQVSAHIYYFEVVLLTGGPMTLGWATSRTDLTKLTKIRPKHFNPIMVGFDEFSIGFDGFNRCIYHDNKTFQLENIPRWKAGDTVGCLIDTTKKHFQFYLNDIQINFNPTQSPIYFSSQPYHCLISLSQLQQVYLNFGQSPFSSHRPKYIDFCDFYSYKSEVKETPIGTVVNFHNANLERNLIAIDANINQRDVTITGIAIKVEKPIEPTSNISSIHTIGNVNVEQVNSRMECRLCCSSSATKLVRFVCCEMLPLCLDCLRAMTECPKCKKQTNDSQTGENQPNEPKPIHPCTLCVKQQVSFRFISCDHYALCFSCVDKFSFYVCPKCT